MTNSKRHRLDIQKLFKHRTTLLLFFLLTVFYYSYSFYDRDNVRDKNTDHHRDNNIRKYAAKKSIFQRLEDCSNIAGNYFQEYVSKEYKILPPYKKVTYCDNVKLTSPTSLQFNNEIWQVHYVNNTRNTVDFSYFNDLPDQSFNVYLYSAFLDNRFSTSKVRVFFMTPHQKAANDQTWKCLLWFPGSKRPVLTDGQVHLLWPERWTFGSRDGIYGPMMLNCDIPKPYHYNKIAPRAVSVQNAETCSEMPKYPKNILRVEAETERIRDESRRLSVGVCSRGIRNGDKDEGIRMIEWLEMLRLLDADKVYLYGYGLVGKMKDILDHYQEEGLVDWRKLNYPGKQMNINLLYNYFYSQSGAKLWPQEMFELNDCLYRNMAKHDYIAVFDMNELIVPVGGKTYPELWETIQKTSNREEGFDYIANHHSYMIKQLTEKFHQPKTGSSQPEEIPNHLFMMKHTYRTGFKKANSKCIFNTSTITTIHTHYAMSCWNGKNQFSKCTSRQADEESEAKLFNFQDSWKWSSEKECSKKEPDSCVFQDRTLWRYYEPLKDAVRKKLVIFYRDVL